MPCGSRRWRCAWGVQGWLLRHFTGRQALLEEMLDTWEKAGTEDIIARAGSQPGDPRAKLQQFFGSRAAGTL